MIANAFREGPTSLLPSSTASSPVKQAGGSKACLLVSEAFLRPGHIGCDELQRSMAAIRSIRLHGTLAAKGDVIQLTSEGYAALTGFEGDDDEWQEMFSEICEEHGWDKDSTC